MTIALALNILFQTTEISELIAALQASHIPQAIVIPVAIILRFLPSLKQDVLYIKQGMKTRGVGLSFWRIVSHPAQTYEGFLVPILMRLLMTATELSASAETRGISYPCEKTHYILVDFRLRDSMLVYAIDFDVTPHQLRHTYITNLLYAGIDPKTVQYLAGHENSKTTMDIYAQVKYNKPEELLSVVNAAFAPSVGV